MKRFRLFMLLLFFASFLYGQNVNVINIQRTGRFQTCNNGNPNITATLVNSTGSMVQNGALVITDPCGYTTLQVNINNLQWNQSPGANWFHGIFFPTNSGVTISGIVMPAGWSDFPTCTGASCSAGETGGQGFYFDNSVGNSCTECWPTLNDGIPSNNYGDIVLDCGRNFNVKFNMTFCNTQITTTTESFTLIGKADGNTGCWSTPDEHNSTVSFSINTVASINPMFADGPTANMFTSCTNGNQLSYHAELVAGCGNGSSVTWWDAAVGGNLVGTGSPFIYNAGSTCPSGTILYAQCCPDSTECDNRTPVVLGACPPPSDTPLMGDIPPQCAGGANPLPTTSLDGTTGTWSPTFDPFNSGTYTFTPDPGQCATEQVTVYVEIFESQTPVFSLTDSYCLNQTPEILSPNSNNNITGSWSPATINTGTVGITTYTFTPDDGQCAEVFTIDIEIEALIMPTFDLVDEYCISQTPANLPTTSDNGYAGTWSPATINTGTVGITTYTFTPNDECADTYSFDVEIVPLTIMEFDLVDEYCIGQTPANLPTTSDNGFAGTWSPATINTGTVGITTYTFTPNDECADTYSFEVEIVPLIEMEFDLVDEYCIGQTPANLPTTSDNGYAGTWSPATINTGTVGITTYTFTPNDECADTYSFEVEIVPLTIMEFDLIDEYCVGQTPANLPTTSDNGYAGTWSPATINTGTVGTTTYTFTPNDECADTYSFEVEIVPLTIMEFDLIDEYCIGQTAAALPTTSDNGYAGTWSPATINTGTVGITTYTFTSTDECADTYSFAVEIVPLVEMEFDLVDEYCIGQTPANLATTSDNGYAGTWSPATINTGTVGTTTYTFTPNDECADTYSFEVEIVPLTIMEFDLVDEYCIGQTPAALPTTSDNGYAGTWSPATINTGTVGTTTYTFTPNDECADTYSFEVEIVPLTIMEFDLVDEYCIGQTPANLPTTSDNGYAGTWSPATINTGTVGITTYTFTPNDECADTYSFEVEIVPLTIMEFDLVDEYCIGQTPAGLPTTSDNGYAGTWSPTTINTGTVGITTYTFTPNDECADTYSFAVEIVPLTIMEFDLVDEYCIGQTAAALPTTSDNGFAGTWSPATINTGTVGITTYTFTPTDECADTYSFDVEIVPLTIMEFDLIDEYCIGQTPAGLPTTSDNGYAGTWSPATINTGTVGITTYTFTPNDECADTYSFDVGIVPLTIMEFDLVDEYCIGQTAAALPTTSDNGFAGTWSPATINTGTVGITTYTFTPNDECADTYSFDVEIVPLTIMEFDLIDEYCIGQTAAALPTTSDNGFAGTWSPATINTSAVGTTTYTFTPNDECADTYSFEVEIVPLTIMEFDLVDEYCIGQTAAALPTTSDNGFAGTWSPATINTGTVGITTYTFTPNDECADTYSFDVEIVPLTIMEFDLIDEYCIGQTAAALPTTSDNGFAGTWSPATINTSAVGTTTYTFTPNDECADTYSFEVEIVPLIEMEFDLIDEYCIGQTAAALPTTSDNGFAGTWSPATINTGTVGITTYTFTPADECAAVYNLSVVIHPGVELNELAVQELCDYDFDGIYEADLLDLNPLLTNQNNVSLYYYASLNDLNNDNPIPFGQLANYQFSSLPTTLYVVGETNHACKSEPVAIQFVARVLANHNPGPFGPIKYCNGDLINLKSLETEISNGPVIFTYYESLINAQDGIALINETESYEAHEIEVIYVRIDEFDKCPVIVEIHLEKQPNPHFDLIEELKLCADSSTDITVFSDLPNTIFQWTFPDGSVMEGATQTIASTGVYQVVAYSEFGCISSVNTLTVTAPTPPTIVGIDVNGSTVTVGAVNGGEGPMEYSLDGVFWQSSNIFYNMVSGQTYTIWVRSYGCEITKEEFTMLLIPNFISPNGDGINDRWVIRGLEATQGSTIKIFDRYGKMFVDTNFEGHYEWDGKYLGRVMPAGDYWYIIHIPAQGLHKEQKFTGHISVRNY